jgi:hypothetical protein
MSDQTNKMPKPYIQGQSINFCISEIIFKYVDGSPSKEAQYQHAQTFKGEWLFDFKIPPFQRPVVWTQNQCIRFIESCWLGFDIGSYVVNKVEWRGEFIHEADGYLLDGLQRITAIKKYINNEFKVFGYCWNELDRVEQRRFEGIVHGKNMEIDNDYVYRTDLVEMIIIEIKPDERQGD